MKKTLLLLTITVCLIACYPNTSMSATPFSAPAVFDLTGSEIGFSLTLDTTTMGQIEASLTPNPAPVTGSIRVSSLHPLLPSLRTAPTTLARHLQRPEPPAC
jgi:hypothetical protein